MTTDIFAAAHAGDAGSILRFIAADPESVRRKGGDKNWDPLTYLFYSPSLTERPEDFLRAARVLLENGASANTGYYVPGDPEPYFESAIYAAAGMAKSVPLTKLLLEFGADPNDNETPYHVPETYENDVMKLLVDSGKLDSKSMTTLLARKHDWHDRDGIAWLLDHGADPNALSHWGRRATHQALERNNRLPIFELLLDHGANPLLADRLGRTGVVLAARFGRPDALDLFAERGFDIALTGANAFLASCARGESVPATPELVAAIQAENPGTLADFAGAGNTAGVTRLLDHGFDPALCTSTCGAREDTALHSAVWRGRHETVRLLIARGAPLEAKNGHGDTVLAYAVNACLRSEWTPTSTEAVAALLAAGADRSAVALPTGDATLDKLFD